MVKVRRLPKRLGALFLALMAGSCGEIAAPPTEVPDAGSNSFARLRVVVTIPRDGDATLYTEARLLRFRELDAETAQVLAGAVTPPLEAIVPGRCVRVDQEALLDDALASASPDAWVRMLDAGDLVVSAAGRAVRMFPSWVPEVVPFVSGVEYEADALAAALPPELRPGEEAIASAYGGPDVGRFDAQVEIPAAPRLVSWGALDGTAELLVELAADGDPGDVAVVLGWGGAAIAGGEVRCRASTRGRVVIPAAAVAGALEAAGREGLRLSVERVSRAPFSAAGLDGGEIEVTVREVVPLPVTE